MKQERIDKLLKNKQIIIKTQNKEIIKSLLDAAAETAEVALSIPLIEKNSTTIFRELYEAIRQLGDAFWWLLGYESQNHDTSLEILKDLDFLEENQKVKLQHINRFQAIRNDANYRGFKVSLTQAEEFIEFWNQIGKSILSNLKKQVK